MPLGVHWTADEDKKLQQLVEKHGPKKWSTIAQELQTKGSKQCRRRWKNFLNADLKSGGWTAEEDATLIQGHREFGNKWTEIAKLVGGRTDNAVKNRWAALCKRNTKLGRGLGGGGGPGRRRRTGSDVDADSPAAQRAPSAVKPERAGPSTGRKRTTTDSAPSVPERAPKRAMRGGPSSGGRSSGAASYHRGSSSAAAAPATSASPRGKKPDLFVSIPNAASAEPHPSTLGLGSLSNLPSDGLGFKVMRELLTPVEQQYARELNEMQVPLHIEVTETLALPPPATRSGRFRGGSAAAAAAAAAAGPSSSSAAAGGGGGFGGSGRLHSPSASADFQEILKWFQTGLTPRLPGFGHGSFGGSGRHSNSGQGGSGNTPKGAPGGGWVPMARQSPRLRAVAAANKAQAGGMFPPPLAPHAGQPSTSSAMPPPPVGTFHDGHRQLLNKLITTAKVADSAAGAPPPGHHPVVETGLAGGLPSARGGGPSTGSVSTGYGYQPGPPSTRATRRSGAPSILTIASPSGVPASSSLLISSRAAGPLTTLSRLLAHDQAPVITPHFSQQELDMLLDALNGDDVVAALPPAPDSLDRRGGVVNIFK